MKVNWVDEKSNLKQYILVDCLSYEEIGRKYNCTGAAVKKAAKRLGIVLPKKRTINKCETFNKGTAKKGVCKNCGKEFVLYKSSTGQFCCHKCHSEYAYNEFIKKWKNGEIDGTINGFKPSDRIRRYFLEKYNGRCQKCGWGEKNEYTGNVPLQIHHVNGDSTDNREENLQLLCPNCHSLTENFGSRNKQAPKGRSEYYDGHKYRKTPR